MSTRSSLLVPLAFIGISQCSLLAQGFNPLITVDQLERDLNRKDLVVLDLGPQRDDYDKSHIPGAIYVDWERDITDQQRPELYNILDRPSMERLFSRLGISKSTRVVCYDALSSRLAIRMFWTLRYYDHRRVQVLDGGFPAWHKASKRLSAETPNVAATNYKIDNVNEHYATTMTFIAKHLDDSDVAILDGRPSAQYTGAAPGLVYNTQAPHKNRGHIPGAVNVFWLDNFNADGTFKTKLELTQLYRPVADAKTVVTYCNEGLHAVPAWFVLTELLGRSDVHVYDSSMAEWANSEKPTVTRAQTTEPLSTNSRGE